MPRQLRDFPCRITNFAMTHPANNGTRPTESSDSTVRILRTMTITTVVMVAASLLFFPWRVSAGLALGGALSLLNFRWMRSSMAAIFSLASTTRPKINIAKYLLRYLVVTAAVLVGYELDIVSLPATIIGLTTFVAGLFVEALREFYLVIAHREEIG